MKKIIFVNIIFFLLLLSSMAWSASYKFDVLQSCGGQVNGYLRSELTCYSKSSTDPVYSDRSCIAMQSNNSETSLVSKTKWRHKFTGWTVVSGDCSFTDANKESTTLKLKGEGCVVKVNRVLTALTLQAGTGGSVIGEEDTEKDCVFFAESEINQGVTMPGAAGFFSYGEDYITYGHHVNITATPDKSYRFENWTVTSGGEKCSIEDKNSKKTSISIPYENDCSVKANFVKIAVLTIGSTTGGSISPSSSKTVDVGTKVKISATPDNSYRFENWTFSSGSGNCSIADKKSKSTTITVNGDCKIKVNFVKTAVLTIGTATGGTSSPSGSQTVDDGARVKITAIPDETHVFTSWSKATNCPVDDNRSATTYVTVNGDCTIKPAFLKFAELTITAGTGGTTTETSKRTYVSGSAEVSVTATPNSGYRFDKWVKVSGGSGCYVIDETSATTNVHVRETCKIRADFVRTYTLKLSAGTGGTTNFTSKTVDTGSKVDISASISQYGYRFDKWTSSSTSCTIADPTDSYTKVTVKGACTVTASFVERNTFAIAANIPEAGSTSPYGYLTVDKGSSKSITATPSSGYRFDKWTSSSASCVIADMASASTSLKVSDNCNITANFVKTQQLTVSTSTGGSVSSAGTKTVDYGSDNTITATPDSSYRFDKWTTDNASCVIADTASDSTTVSVSANCNITANFVKIQYIDVSAGTGGSTSPSTYMPIDSGATLQIMATPDSSYRFDKWTSDNASCVIADTASDSTSVKVSDDCSVKATFVKTYNFSVNANIDAGGTVSPDEDQTVDEGTSNSISATPSSGYRFDKWTSDKESCVIADTASDSTTVNVSADCNITANFVKIQNVTIAGSTGGHVKSPGSSTVDIDTEISLSAVEDTGYVFDRWVSTSTGCIVADPASLSTTVSVGDDCSVTATFVKMEYVFLEEDLVRDIDSVETTEVDFAFSLSTVSPTYDKIDTVTVALFTDQGDTLWVPAYETDVHSGEYEGRSSFRFVTSSEDQKDDVLDAVMDLDTDVNRAVIRMQIGKDKSALDSRDSIVVFYGFIPADSAEILDQDQDGQADLVRVHFAKSILHEQLKIDTLFWGGTEDDGREVASRDMEISGEGDWIYVALDSPFEYGVTAVDSTGKKFVKISRNTSSAIQKVTLSDKVGPVPVRAVKRPGQKKEDDFLNNVDLLPLDTLEVTMSEPVEISENAKAFDKNKKAWSTLFQYSEKCGSGKIHPVTLKQEPKLDESGLVWTMVLPRETDARAGYCLMTNPDASIADEHGNAPGIGGVVIEGEDSRIYLYSIKPYPAISLDTISAIRTETKMAYRASVSVFDNLGNFVAHFRTNFGKNGELEDDDLANPENSTHFGYIEWDQRNNKDGLVGTGVYIWKIKFRFDDGHKETRTVRTGIRRR